MTALITMAPVAVFAADDTATDTNGTYNVDTVVVTGTRQGTSIGGLAGNDTVLDKNRIGFVAALQPGELLNQVPGVVVERDNGVEHFTAIRSPAFNGGEGAGSFLYLEDGVPLRAAGFADVNGLGEAYADQAASVEVVRGPGSALYGSNAMHGLMNVIPRNPSQIFENEVDVMGGYVAGGRVNGVERAMASSSGTDGDFGLRLSALEHHEDGWRRDTRFDQQKWQARSIWAGADDTVTTTFTGERLDEQSGAYIVGRDAYRSADLAESNPIPTAYRLNTSLRVMSRWQHDISDTLQLSITPYSRYSESNFLMHYLPSHAIQTNEHASGGSQFALYQTLAGGHQIIVGTDVEYTSGGYTEFQSIPTVTGGYIHGWHYNLDVDSTVVAPYVHSEWRLLDQTKATFGARLESTTYAYTNELSNGVFGLFKRIPSRTDDFLTFTPKFGLVQEWSKHLANYVNLSVGSRAPQVTDLYEMQSQQAPGQIKSENLHSAETGTRGNWGPMNFDIDGYYMTKDHYFYRDVSGLNIADGKTLHRGLEADIRTALGGNFDLGVAASYALHTYEFTNLDTGTLASASVHKNSLMPNAPREQADVRLGYAFAQGARAEVEWQVIGPYVTDQADMHSYGGYSLINLRTDVPLNDLAKVYVKITNAANVKYADRATVTTASTHAASQDEYFPGQPFTILGGVNVKF